MAFWTPRTWVNGEIPNDTMLNQQIRDNIRYLKGQDGTVIVENSLIAGPTTPGGAAGLLLGGNASGDRAAIITLVSDATYTNGIEILRNAGANGASHLQHRGTGDLTLRAVEAAAISLQTSNAERLRISSAGAITAKGDLTIGSAAAATATYLTVGKNSSGNRYAVVDLVGDDTYPTYGTRLLRGDTGANAFSQLLHRGTGQLAINAIDAGSIGLYTSNAVRLTISATGVITAANALFAGNFISSRYIAAGSLVPPPSGMGIEFFASDIGAGPVGIIQAYDRTAAAYKPLVYYASRFELNYGSVGIGTATPGSPLSVAGGIAAGAYSANTAPANGLIVSGIVGIGTGNPQGALHIVGTNGGAVYVDTAVAGSAYYVLGAGSVSSAYNLTNLIIIGPSGAAYGSGVSIGTSSQTIVSDSGSTLQVQLSSGALILQRTAGAGTFVVTGWISYN